MSQPCWASSNQLVHSKNSRGMTLLHLAAAQGYAGLIQTLIRWRWVTLRWDPPLWRQSNFSFAASLHSTKHADSIDLELEVDPLNVDHFSCTPLVSDQYCYILLHFFHFFSSVYEIDVILSSADVGVCFGPHWGSTGSVPVGPKSSCHSRLSGSPAAEYRPIPWSHSIGRALGAAAAESSN